MPSPKNLSSLDDEDFRHEAAQKLDKTGLLNLRLTLQLQLDTLKSTFDKARRRGYTQGKYMVSDEFSSLERLVRRKGHQLQWIQNRITTLNDEAKNRIDPQEKAQARESFFQRFFELARKNIDRNDFKYLCSLAEAEVDRANAGR